MGKTLKMGEKLVLDVCRDIELDNAKIYYHLAGVFAEDAELAALWKKTAQEEENHARQFDLALKVKHDLLDSVEMDLLTVEKTAAKIASIVENIKHARPTVLDALRFAMKLEAHLAQFHLECVSHFSNEESEKLFHAMMAADEKHLQSIKDMYTARLVEEHS